MKILIYGAGVIGCTYGWQFAGAGYNVSLLVRNGKSEKIREEGIPIHSADYRNGEKRTSHTLFRPEVIEELTPVNDFDYIIVSVASMNLEEILPVLSEKAGKAHVIFFLNLWDEFNNISSYLSSQQYSFGFPFMAGGGRDDDAVNSVISGSKYSKTMLGNPDGLASDKLREFACIVDKANLKPFISGQIVNWLVPHYVFIAAISAGIIQSGGTMAGFLKNKKIIKSTVKAIREGFCICDKRGVVPKKEKVNRLYYLPFFICIPIMRKIFSSEDMASMFDGYLKHSIRDIKYMLDKVISSGLTHMIEMTHLISLRKNLENL